MSVRPNPTATASAAIRKAGRRRPFAAAARRRRGGKAHGVVTRFGALRDPDLAGFVAESISFPNTMVDRIAPAARFIAQLWPRTWRRRRHPFPASTSRTTPKNAPAATGTRISGV
jgi:hypothetical protein